MLSLSEAQTNSRQEAGVAADMIAALVALEPQAWQQLFDGYYQKMYRFAYARTGDASASEEIASEVFAAAANGIGRYKPTGAPFAAWLYRIARNLTADHLDRLRRRPSVPLEDIDVASAAWDGSVEDAADISKALAQLTSEQQEVIVLRFFNDASLQEVAEALGKSVGAVKLLQHRALGSLRRHLTEAGGKA